VRRWVILSISGLAVCVVVIAVFVATRPPPFDAFPVPPSPSIAPDGSRVFSIASGTHVELSATMVDPGDVIACAGKGRVVVPPAGEIEGPVYVSIDDNGGVIAECEPFPLAEM
jgi:hypothetical protein